MTDKNKKIIEQINNGIIPEGYKKTKIGIVPVEWDEIRLGDIGSTYTGLSGKTKKDFGHGKAKYIPYVNIFNNMFVDVSALEDIEIDKKQNCVKKGDVFFTTSSETPEEVGMSSVLLQDVENTYLNSFCFGFRPEKILDIIFLAFMMRSDLVRKQFKILAQGISRFNISKAKAMEEIQSLLPPLPEQQKIAEILSTQDKLIELYERKIEQLKTLKKGYLQKMFPKKGCKYPELRFKGFTEPWEQRKLGEIGQTYTGLSGKTKEDFGHGKAKFVTYMNVFSNPVAEISMTEPIEIDKRQNEIKYGDVFFTTSSETPEEVGMSSVWLENGDNTYLNSFCFGYRPIENINPFYMAYMLRSESVRKKITFLAQGISRYNISKNKMMEISIPLSKIEEQKKIGDYFRNLDRLITLHQHKLDKEKQKKKALMQLLLTGKVRVST